VDETQTVTARPLTTEQFRIALNWFMCADPWTGTDEEHAAIEALLNKEAVARGHDDWVKACHAIKDMRDISTCHQNLGYHVYGAGPCFDGSARGHREAVAYRDYLDSIGETWLPQGGAY
jgi:hypothetical protein